MSSCATSRYNNNLSEARDKGIRKGLILGLSMGGTWFVVYAAYSLGFWYGAKLIREDDSYTPGRLLIVSGSSVRRSLGYPGSMGWQHFLAPQLCLGN